MPRRLQAEQDIRDMSGTVGAITRPERQDEPTIALYQGREVRLGVPAAVLRPAGQHLGRQLNVQVRRELCGLGVYRTGASPGPDVAVPQRAARPDGERRHGDRSHQPPAPASSPRPTRLPRRVPAVRNAHRHRFSFLQIK